MNLITRSALGLAVCTALGTAAQAFPVTDYAGATKVYFGGATATDNVLEAAFLDTGFGVCDTVIGNIDIYRAANQRVIACYVSNDNTPGLGFATRAAGGTRIAFHKESQGGSSNGVNPLIAVSANNAHSLRWLDIAQLAADDSSCPGVPVAASGTFSAYTNHPGCPASLTTVDVPGPSTYDAHGGISDVEPKLSFPAPTQAEINRLVSNAGVGIVFGVPVTTVLYRALQKAQYGNGSACDGSDATNCVPSLTRNQVRALYTQSIFDWNDFKGAAGDNVALTAVAGVTAPADEFVRVCRRVATSGTQASYETYYLHQRCVGNLPATFANPDDSSTITDTSYSPNQFLAGSLVNAAPSSGNVVSCMNSANSNNFWAVGVLSTEINDATFATAGFRFAAVDGAAPNLVNVANGDYDFFTENTLNRIASGNPGYLCANSEALGGACTVEAKVRRGVIEAINQRLGNVSALGNLNGNFDGRPWGNGGVLALATVPTTNTAPYSAAELSSQPVNTQSRGGNNCAPPVMVKPQPVNGSPNP